jgi:hypothetical protein
MEDIQESRGAGNTGATSPPRMRILHSLVNNTGFRYAYMVSILMYILLCGYFLIFAGSLLVEAISQKWYSADAADFDAMSFLLGYLYGFPSLLGVLGGIAVMSSSPKSWFRFKVLLFVPAAVWSTLLVLDLARRPLYWSPLVYHIPAMILCIFVLAGVALKACTPYHDAAWRE